MNFSEANEELRFGKKIRRKAWEKSMFIQKNPENQVMGFRQETVGFHYELDIMSSVDWIIMTTTGDILATDVTFDSMIVSLTKGLRATLPEWPENCFIEASASKKEIYMRKICEYAFIPTFECFTSNDWEAI